MTAAEAANEAADPVNEDPVNEDPVNDTYVQSAAGLVGDSASGRSNVRPAVVWRVVI